MTKKTNLALVDGHTFHRRLKRNTLISSSEAAPKNTSGPAKTNNNPGLFVISLKRFLILEPEVDGGSSSERTYCDMMLVIRITIARMSVESKSEYHLPGFKFRLL
jgi:hypothetical protein